MVRARAVPHTREEPMLMEAPRTIAREKAGNSVPAIALNNVTRRFVTPDGKMMTALRDFTMNVAQGEFACVVGPTGCGKSTTLNLVTGLAKPSAGEVRLMGKSIEGISHDIRQTHFSPGSMSSIM